MKDKKTRDYIDRNELIEALKRSCEFDPAINAVIMSIPSITAEGSQEQRWIPVSEEPITGIYLVTRQYKQHRYVEMATYDGDDPQDVFSWEGYSDEWKFHRAEHKVLAWKPAPEPYGGEEE